MRDRPRPSSLTPPHCSKIGALAAFNIIGEVGVRWVPQGSLRGEVPHIWVFGKIAYLLYLSTLDLP